MPSDELISLEGNPHSARNLAQESSRRLQEIAQAHQLRFGNDTLSLFLGIHGCIAVQVSKRASSSDILLLNHYFVSRALRVYQSFLVGDFSPRSLSPAWVFVYSKYCDDPRAAGALLPRTAAVRHIEDLEAALYEAPVGKDEYDGSLPDILECLDATIALYRYPTAKDQLLHILQDRLGNSLAGSYNL